MKRLAFVALLIGLPAVVLGSTQHYIVVTSHPFNEAVERLPREDFGPAAGARVFARPFHVINGFDAEMTDEQVKRLLATGEVEDIEPVVERHVMDDDTITPGQQTMTWGVQAVKAPDVWPVSKGAALNGSGPIHVAVIDTGIDYHSPELQAAFKGGHNFITGSDDPLDDFGHGTHVSGIIAAADNHQGVVGVAPAVDLYGLKILDQCGSGSSSKVIHAIDWIITKKQEIGGNWVANLSLGSDTPSTAEQEAFQRGINAGIIFVAASGNSFSTTPDGLAFPAGYPGVMSVGAIDQTDLVAPFSQRGADLKVVAPGVAVLSTVVGASVAMNDGRTFAATLPTIVKDNSGTPLDNYCLPQPNVNAAPFVFCAFGGAASDFPASVRGKIALISRGKANTSDPDITFKMKITNAQTAGAVGAIIYNNNADEGLISPALGNYLTPSAVPTFIPFVFISNADGLALKGSPNATVTLGFGFEGFELLDGTSMATPHATGVVALAWSVAPNAASTDVRDAIINTASDLGDPGVDTTYGHGLVNALNAAKQLNPAAFGASSTPPPVTGRPPGRRGH
jgi:serine protease